MRRKHSARFVPCGGCTAIIIGHSNPWFDVQLTLFLRTFFPSDNHHIPILHRVEILLLIAEAFFFQIIANMTEQPGPNILLQLDGYPGMNPETQPAALDVGDTSFNSARTATNDKKPLLYKPEKRHDRYVTQQAELRSGRY